MSDLISREETLTAFADYVGSGMSMDDFDALWNIVTKMPSVKQEPSRDIKEIAEIMKCDADAETKCKMISNILTAKPHYFEEQEPSGDLISKQASISKIKELFLLGDCYCDEHSIVGTLNGMPSVKQEPKTGHWIEDNQRDLRICSICGRALPLIPRKDYYCPHCGARMESEKGYDKRRGY